MVQGEDFYTHWESDPTIATKPINDTITRLVTTNAQTIMTEVQYELRHTGGFVAGLRIGDSLPIKRSDLPFSPH